MPPYPRAASLSLAERTIQSCLILAVGAVVQPLTGLTFQTVRAEAPKHAEAIAATKNAASKSKTSEKSATVSSEIEETLKTQADAWNAGDLDKFMTSYLKSPDISFVSTDGEMKGYDALEARYRKKYGTSRDTMGKLSFSELETRSLGNKNALCIGHWLVEREGKPHLKGIFSLVLIKVDGRWKLVHDHTSLFHSDS